MIPNFLRKKLSYLKNNLKGSKQIFKREDLFNKTSSTNTKIVNKNDPLFMEIGNEFYQKDTKINKEINSVCGWVPFIKGYTKIMIYNLLWNIQMII